MRTRLHQLPVALLLGAIAGPAVSAGTAFTYQGLIEDSGTPAAAYDFQVLLYADADGTTQVAGPFSFDDVAVDQGRFLLTIDPGASAFSGPDRWLELRVRRGTETGGFTQLLPRQALLPTPYAQHAGDADFAADVADAAITTAKLADGAVSAAKVDSAQVQLRIDTACGADQVMTAVNADGSPVCTALPAGDITGVSAGAGLSGGGSSGSVNLAVDPTQVQSRIGTACGAGNVMTAVNEDGSPVCTALPVGDITGVGAGTGLSGGGSSGSVNLAVDPTLVQSRIGTACVAGNVMTAVNQDGSPVCTALPVGDITGVGAGTGLSGGGSSGSVNLAVDPTLVQSRIGTSCVAGQAIRVVAQDGSVTCEAIPPAVTDYWAIGGNAGTTPLADNFLGTTDAAAFELRVNNERAWRVEPGSISPNLIGGYSGNSVAGGIQGATIGGGGFDGDVNVVTGDFATIGGGSGNFTAATGAVVGGGHGNGATGVQALVGAGFGNVASGVRAVIAGGNSNTASGEEAAIGGGRQNAASNFYATVAGGFTNTASGTSTTVAGGAANTASVSGATVGGGSNNTASASFATIPGGVENCAGAQLSFAGGFRAKVRPANNPGSGQCSGLGAYPGVNGDEGSFLWADASTTTPLISSASHQFLVRSSGGVRFFTNAGMTTGVQVAGGSGTWASVSDRAAKTDIAEVQVQDVLARVLELPIYEWRYLSQAPDIRHLGPMAQDFHAAFGLNGADDKTIATVDPDGVALAAIQGLHAQTQALRDADLTRINALERENAALRARLDALEARWERVR